jgi:hypothetical protein
MTLVEQSNVGTSWVRKCIPYDTMSCKQHIINLDRLI